MYYVAKKDIKSYNVDMRINRFEDVVSWQKAKLLSVLIYKNFSACKDYSFRDQIQRAAVSIMNNIAEGFERGGDKELKYFLFVAKGSCGEVRSMLILAKELELLSVESYQEAYILAEDISKLLSGFIKKL